MTSFATRAGQNLARTISIVVRVRAGRRDRAVVDRVRREHQQAHRLLRPDHRRLPGLHGARARRAGRHHRRRHAGGHPGQGRHVDRPRASRSRPTRRRSSSRPSVVSDRYIQLAPVYTGGPAMSDNATIPRDRTATPVELDQLYTSLNKLATSLGPNGANSKGALSNLLNTAAANLERQRRRTCTTPSRSSRTSRRRWTATRTTCSPQWTTWPSSPPPWPTATPPSARSPSSSPT